MTYQVNEVAQLAGISVRTLHHYDRIKLLCPSGRTPAGYRLYTQADIDRLQEILFFKELSFALRDIKDILESPDYSRRQSLILQAQLLEAKQAHIHTQLTTI